MTETKPTRRPRKREPIPTNEARRLLAAQRRIDDGRVAADERAALMADLYDAGWSYSAIADVIGVNHEAVRKAILTRTDEGYPHRS